MRSILGSCATVFALALVTCGRMLPAQESTTAEGAAAKAWNAFYQSEAEEAYRFSLEPGKVDLKLDSTPILRWTNPLEQGDIHGVVYVWRKAGRAVVVGQLFSYLDGKGGRVYCHAMHSLARSDEKLTGTREGKVFWTPDSPGVELHDVPMAPPPAANRSGRLVQIKAISRRFSAYTEEATRGKRVLRLLPTPLDRSPESAPENSDSALFSLVVGNDPEVILVVEKRDTAPEGSVWQYGLVQSTRSTTVVLLDDKEVWRRDSAGKPPSDSRGGYLSVHGIATLPLKAPVRPAR